MTNPILPAIAPVLCAVCNAHILDVNTKRVCYPFESVRFAITERCIGFGAWELPREITLDVICPLCSSFPFHYDEGTGGISPMLTIGRWDDTRESWEAFQVHIPHRFEEAPEDGQESVPEEGNSEEGAVQEEAIEPADPGCESDPSDQKTPDDTRSTGEVGGRATGDAEARISEPNRQYRGWPKGKKRK